MHILRLSAADVKNREDTFIRAGGVENCPHGRDMQNLSEIFLKKLSKRLDNFVYLWYYVKADLHAGVTQW